MPIAGIARAGRDRRGAEHQAQDRDRGGLAGAFVDADRMAAGDVAKLVGDHALQLVDVVGRGQQAAVDIDDLALRDEGVDLADR